MQQYNTFWKIIKENEIVIPTIQRDYAYGREEASNILSNLINNIKHTLDNEDAQLHLAFVYGKIDGTKNDELLLRNSENIKSLLQSVREYANDLNIIVDFDTKREIVRLSDNVKFVPIDGQQRLTTLFLVHWYLAMHLKNDEALKVFLRKFQYATRVSSKDFCNLICSIDSRLVGSEIDSNLIRNQEGYFKQWQNDPTVKNMLIVIDKINNTFKSSKEVFSKYWEQLINSDKVCFDFFDLDNFHLSDELYVKMNSRGKKLTQFENFKAWLYHQKKIEIGTKKKIDIAWYDMFWKAQGNETKDIDTAYLQWFKNLFIADYLKELELVDNQDLNYEAELDQCVPSNLNDFNNSKSTIAILRNGDGKFLDFILGSERANTLVLYNIESYFKKLDCIVRNYQDHLNFSVNKEYYSFFLEQLLFTEQNSLNWSQVTFQYAVIEYMSSNAYNEVWFTDFLRVISNLIFNTAINGPKDYLLAIKSIERILAEFNGDILTYLRDVNIDKITFFSSSQKDEEKIKAFKCFDIVSGKGWKEAIIEVENHKYFYGQIGFLFTLLKEDGIEEFKKLSARFQNLFSDQVIEKADNFLFRALLSGLGKTLFSRNGNVLRFPTNDGTRLRNRNENWRRNLLNVEKIGIISGLIQNSEFDVLVSAVEFLDNSIINYPPDGSFLYPLIKNKDLLKNAKQNCLCDCSEQNDHFYLLNTTSLRGNYRELFVMDWYLQNGVSFINDPIIEISIKELQYDVDDEPGIRITVKNSLNEYIIYRNYSKKLFDLFGKSGSIIKSDKEIDTLIEFIKKETIVLEMNEQALELNPQ